MTAWLSPDEWQAVRLSLSVATRSVVFSLPLAIGVVIMIGGVVSVAATA